MKPSEILRAAREKIANPERWTQKRDAADLAGEAVAADNPGAVCWCASGAVFATSGEVRSRRALLYLKEAAAPLGVWHWNDAKGRTHAEVLAGFDAAIALAEQEGQ